MSNKLTTFLLGTIDPHSALRILRGKGDILRIIWIYACSEWWQLHIQPYIVPNFQDRADLSARDELEPSNIANLKDYNDFRRRRFFDCPFAVIAENVSFPPIHTKSAGILSSRTIPDPIYVNMMPFDLFNPTKSLPTSLHAYLPLIENCRQYVKSYADYLKSKQGRVNSSETKQFDGEDIKHRIAYITVDERPVLEAGQPQRRGGVHVECPGALRRKEIADKSKYTNDICHYHLWGMGLSDGEYFIGGIFLGSNVSNTTAVWNSRIHDTFGDIIGPHGSLERVRDALGPPTKTLAAGELIWLSDRTPHESLPIQDPSIQRQFFRLVVGEITFWFADHNTPNPTGFRVPEEVQIIYGNKFDLIPKKIIPIIWECGNRKEIQTARKERFFREKLYQQGVGFLADDLLKIGIYNQETMKKNKKKLHEVLNSLDEYYFSRNTMSHVLAALARVCKVLWL